MLVHVAGNWGKLAPTLAAHIESEDVRLEDGSDESVPLWSPDGESSIAVRVLQGSGQGEGRTEAEDSSPRSMAGGSTSREVKDEVSKVLDLSRKTVERYAAAMEKRGELVIEVENTFPKTTTWHLREQDGGDGGDGEDSGDSEDGSRWDRPRRDRMCLLGKPAWLREIGRLTAPVGTRPRCRLH